MDDPEVRKAHVLTVQTEDVFSERFRRFSSWQKLLKSIALCLKFKKKLLNKRSSTVAGLQSQIFVEDLKEAEIVILRIAQRETFPDDIDKLQSLGVTGLTDSREIARKRKTTLNKSSTQT